MKKIPTMFDRDWDGDRSRVLDKPHPDCAWVFAGQGVATIKLDGTCCLVRSGQLLKRRELKQGSAEPEGFELVDEDAETGKIVGWVPVGDGPEDRWYREASVGISTFPDGTYELIGPKVQGGAEKTALDEHTLVPHGMRRPDEEPPRDFHGLRDWLFGLDIEGLVFHHPDGRMAKIKLRDFGLKRRT